MVAAAVARAVEVMAAAVAVAAAVVVVAEGVAVAAAAVLAARMAVDGLPALSTHSAGRISCQAVVCDHLRQLP